MKKPVLICGEAWGDEEVRQGKPFVGPSGSVLKSLLRQVGIPLDNCYLTNVFNFKPPGNKIEALCGSKTEAIPFYREIARGKYIHKSYQPELDRLHAEIESVNPNLIIALGNTPLWAICKKAGIKKYRGSPLPSHDGRYKVLPTWHPAAVLRQWELRPICFADLSKAREEMAFPDLVRPQRFIYLYPTIEEIEEFYEEFLSPAEYISCDIETKQGQITEVGYGTPDGKYAIVIPFWDREKPNGNYWSTLSLELKAWSIVRKINANHKLLGQNFSYDMQYFWRTVRIPCPHFEGDTMLAHHSLQPEMEKGLGFLGSVYTKEPSWKFMRTDHATLKKGDD